MIEFIDVTDLPAGLGKHLWQTSLFFLAVLALTSALRDGSARVRYSLWLLVVIRLLVPISIALPEGVWPQDTGRQTLGMILDPIAALAQPASARVENTFVTQPISAPAIDSASPFPWEAMLIALWIAISGALLIRYLQRANQIRKLNRTAIAAPPAWIGATRAISDSMGLGPVEVRVSEDLASPAAIGAFRPTVLIPTHLIRTLNAVERDAVLLHELTHIKRHDLGAQMLSALASVLFPFHPATWIASRKLARERELAVDEAVLESRGIDAMSYAKTLVEVAAAVPANTGNTLHLAHLSAAGKDLKDRVVAARSIAGQAGVTPVRARWPIVAAGLAFALTMLPASPAVAAGDGELDRFMNEELKRAKITLPTSTHGTPIGAGGVRAIIVIESPGALPRVEVKTSPVTDGGFPTGARGGFPAIRGPKAAITITRPSIEISSDDQSIQVKLDGKVIGNADDIGAELKASNPPGSVVAHVKIAPAVPVHHVATIIASLQGAMEDISLVFEGVQADQERMPRIKEAVAALTPDGKGDVLIVMDRNVPWQQHAEVLWACGTQRIANTTIAVQGPEGELRKLCQYLPSDEAIVEEIEIEEVEPEEVEEIEIEDGEMETEEEIVEEAGGGGRDH